MEILKWEIRLPFPYRGAQFPYFHRCVKPGLVTPSKKHDSQLHLDRSREFITFQCPTTKGSGSSPKKAFKQKILNKRILIASDNASVFSYLNKWGGGHVPPSLVHLGQLESLKYAQKRQTYSGLLKCHGQHPLQKGQRFGASWPTAILEIYS